ncbi:hypothetical protein [Anaerospora hongkongensis]|uniref:hypothetical protein n=1 Tax=Anaerospora hongkongensis TaxID=244830 RepID=UPI0028989C4B|nr:hypothetical protein [Anaerospora hongkongensis]
MNKIKVLYDVVKAIRTKEEISGLLTADIQKDQISIFTIKNQFEKNFVTGQTKAQINTQVDYEGKTVRHDSDTEFSMPSGRGFHHGHHGMAHRHHFGAMAAMLHHGGRCGQMGGRFAKLAFVFGLLNSLEVKETQDNTLVLSLDSANLPDDAKELLCERISHSGGHHSRHGFMKEFSSLKQLDFTITAWLDADCDVTKVAGVFSGIQQDEQLQEHVLKANGEVVFHDKENK